MTQKESKVIVMIALGSLFFGRQRDQETPLGLPILNIDIGMKEDSRVKSDVVGSDSAADFLTQKQRAGTAILFLLVATFYVTRCCLFASKNLSCLFHVFPNFDTERTVGLTPSTHQAIIRRSRKRPIMLRYRFRHCILLGCQI